MASAERGGRGGWRSEDNTAKSVFPSPGLIWTVATPAYTLMRGGAEPRAEPIGRTACFALTLLQGTQGCDATWHQPRVWGAD